MVSCHALELVPGGVAFGIGWGGPGGCEVGEGCGKKLYRAIRRIRFVVIVVVVIVVIVVVVVVAWGTTAV